MSKLPFELSEALKGKYEVVNTSSPCLHSKIGWIDFRTLTEEQAEELIKAGTMYLKKITPVKRKGKTE